MSAGWRLLVLVALCSACASNASNEKLESGHRSVGLDRACTVAGPEVCFNARDDNCNGPIDEGCGLESGLIQFAIAWDEAEADVDLEVTDPKGEVVELGRATSGGLVKDRDCPGRDNDCRGLNVENVTLTAGEKLLRGTYVVRVRLESWGKLEAPVRVNLGVRMGPKSHSRELSLVHEKEARRFEFEL